jgi:hypothetical protein
VFGSALGLTDCKGPPKEKENNNYFLQQRGTTTGLYHQSALADKNNSGMFAKLH